MAAGSMNNVIRHLHRTVLAHDTAGLTDGQLLESFVSTKDEAAFEALLQRHGAMVLGVCRPPGTGEKTACQTARQARRHAFGRVARRIACREGWRRMRAIVPGCCDDESRGHDRGRTNGGHGYDLFEGCFPHGRSVERYDA